MERSIGPLTGGWAAQLGCGVAGAGGRGALQLDGEHDDGNDLGTSWIRLCNDFLALPAMVLALAIIGTLGEKLSNQERRQIARATGQRRMQYIALEARLDELSVG